MIGLGNRMVSWLALVVTLTLAIAASAQPAQAKIPLMFGTRESLNEIVPLKSKGPKGEALFLGYKTSRYSFFLPYRLIDDGYIVGVKGLNSYFTLDPAKIKSLQATGELPTPLPTYEIDPIEYAFGHSLWTLPALFGVIFWFTRRGEKTRQTAMPLFESAQVHHNANNLDAAVPITRKPSNSIPSSQRRISTVPSSFAIRANRRTQFPITPRSSKWTPSPPRLCSVAAPRFKTSANSMPPYPTFRGS